MALLGTIRNRFGWVMMGLIFVGIGSFLFMDASGPQNQMGGMSSKAGAVNGQKITREEIRVASQNFQGQGLLQEEIDKIVWDQLVAEKLLYQKATEAGFDVTADEMGELFLSEDFNKISPLVARQFMDRTTGQINFDQIRQALTLFKNKTTATANVQEDNQKAQMLEQYSIWKNLEKKVYEDRLQQKYFTAIDLGFYTPDWMATMENDTRKSTYNFEYVSIPYTAVEGAAAVTDEDVKQYIAANARQYKRKATAALDYVLFNVVATTEDSADYRSEMSTLASDFVTTGDDTLFVESNDGQFASDYFTADEIKEPLAIKDSLMQVADGTVLGPYLHNGQYRVVKLYDSKTLADSVKSRHILYKAKTAEEGQKGRILLDSLKKVLETDPSASFDSLAIKFSQDGSAAQGGDLGWKAKDGSFVPQFEEHMFYTGEKDSLKIIYTQFGVHLIQITGYKFIENKKGLRLAIISRDVIPSERTNKAVRMMANNFMNTNRTVDKMKEAAIAAGLQVGSAAGLEEGAYEITGVGKNSASAEFIEWAHKAETTVNTVCPNLLGIDNDALNYTERYVVAAITDKTAAGLASSKDPIIKDEVSRILSNQKKAAVVNNKLKEVTTLEALASNYSVAPKTAANVQYDNANLPDAGVEPKVLAAASSTSEGKLSTAVDGREGIYVVRLIGKNTAPAVTDMKNARKDITTKVSSAILGTSMGAPSYSRIISDKVFADIKENTTIQDKREEY